MLINSRSIPDKKTIQTNLCIIGAGAAGITIAREFANSNISVSLLESGGLSFEKEIQSLNKGKTTITDHTGFSKKDNDYLYLSRKRYFGGSTNCWMGWCRPLDAIDFEPRSWVPYSGWPFNKSHIERYYEEASSICQIRPYDHDTNKLDIPPREPYILDDDEYLKNTAYYISPGKKFGEIYKDDILSARNINVFTYANVTRIQSAHSATNIDSVVASSLDGNEFRIKAKIFILATGGIENARLLLISNKIPGNRVGGRTDLVGRYFMDHPHMSGLARVYLPSIKRTDTFYDRHEDSILGHKIKGALHVREETQVRNKLLNSSIGFTDVKLNRAKKSKLNKLLNRIEFNEAVLQTTFDMNKALGNKAFTDFSAKEALYRVLTIRTEQSPNPESRVTLSDELDEMGQNKVRLDWQMNDLDYMSIQKSIELVREAFGINVNGRIGFLKQQSAYGKIMHGGYHHIGTTRMHINPDQGVVDGNCKVHGVPNLYIAGSSVFPTSGLSNPTLTIIALGLRMSDHIKKILT